MIVILLVIVALLLFGGLRGTGDVRGLAWILLVAIVVLYLLTRVL